MKFSLNKILSVSALFALATLTIAAPLTDVSLTSVDLVENTYNAKGDEHLFVTVTRVDDLLDDDGLLLAERVMAVRVTFDVFENQLMCNGRPVEIGVSNIQVEAQMASNPEKLAITTEEDAAILADSFDIGLVTVEVTASILDELKTDDGLTFRRLSVKELITEVNGQKVVQTEAGQQILDVFDNGSLIKWSVDPLTGFMLPGPAIMDENIMNGLECPGCQDMVSIPEAWWNEATQVQQGLIIGSVIAFFIAIVLAIRQLIVSARSNYEAVALTQDDAVVSSSEEIWDSKQQQQQPPAYVEQEEEQLQQQEEKKPFLADDA